MYLQYRVKEQNNTTGRIVELIQDNNRPDEDNEKILNGVFWDEQHQGMENEEIEKPSREYFLSLIFSDFKENDFLVIKDRPFNYPLLDLSNNTIKEATRIEKITVLGFEENKVLIDGEYIQDNEIIKVEYDPKLNFYKPKWNRKTHIWEEGATDKEIVNKDYNDYLTLNHPIGFRDMEAQGVLNDYLAYIDSCRTYLFGEEAITYSMLSTPLPTENLKQFKLHYKLK